MEDKEFKKPDAYKNINSSETIRTLFKQTKSTNIKKCQDTKFCFIL